VILYKKELFSSLLFTLKKTLNLYIYTYIFMIKIANLENKNLSDVSETQKHLICVSTVVRIIYDLETLIYVSETHNYKGACVIDGQTCI